MPARLPPLGKLLGVRIAQLRAEKGLTQERVAWDIDLASKGYLSRIESGERLPSLDVLRRIAERLGLEIRDLLTFPERGPVDEAIDLVRRRGRPLAQEVLRVGHARGTSRPVGARRPSGA